MKRHLAPALFSLSLCAVLGGVRTAGAQTVDAVAPTTIDTASTIVAAGVAEPSLTITTAERAWGAPLVFAPTPIRLGESSVAADQISMSPTVAAVEWKMPTSRALMIGGAATAIVGLAAVGGDTGAIIALSGTAVAVYGLYLHYNR